MDQLAMTDLPALMARMEHLEVMENLDRKEGLARTELLVTPVDKVCVAALDHRELVVLKVNKALRDLQGQWDQWDQLVKLENLEPKANPVIWAMTVMQEATDQKDELVSEDPKVSEDLQANLAKYQRLLLF